MLQPMSNQWCTTQHKTKEFATALAQVLGLACFGGLSYGHGDLDGPFFVGSVPRTAGAQRPAFPLVFLVAFRGHRLLACGNSVQELALELAQLPRKVAS